MGQGCEPTICIAEDRASMEPGLRLLIHSLSIHSPTLKSLVFYPVATEEFKSWISGYPNCTLRLDPIKGKFSKYDVKPNALLQLLDEGVEDVVWLDTDLIVSADVRPFFTGLSASTVVIAEEALVENHSDDGALRTRLWGMDVGRTLPFALNTAAIRLTTEHRDLLEKWKELLGSPEYQAAQLKPADPKDIDPRPVHMLGDQDVLTALLASKQFAALPLRILKRGTEIVQFFGPYGYTVTERVYHLRKGFAPLVHSMGQKPWWPRPQVFGKWQKFCAFYGRSSPYTVVAGRHAGALVSAGWLRPEGSVDRLVNFIGFGNPALVGLPIAAFADFIRGSKFVRKRAAVIADSFKGAAQARS
jgi:hypothetical protein